MKEADAETDHELIYAAQSGDRAAFSRLLGRHYRFMYKAAWQWCGLKEDAEDIAQEAAIKLARSIGDFRFEAAFTSWLYRLVLNTAKDYRRAKARRHSREQPLFEEEVSPAASPEELAAQRDVLKAVTLLPETLRETVWLVCGQGLSHKEAAGMLKCSEGTISWRIHEARKKIAEALAPEQKGKSHG